MLQTKLIQAVTKQEFEDQLNRFLEKFPAEVVQIQFSTSFAGTHNGIINSALVTYKQ